MTATLLFPAGMQGALDYLIKAPKAERIIGASSVANDPAMASYKEWLHLPFITDDSFAIQFQKAVDQFSITRVFTAHPVINRHLKSLVDTKPFKLEVIGSSFEDSQIRPHRELMQRIDRAMEERLFPDESSKGFPDRLQMAALIKHALRIEGQSDEAKLWAMTEIAGMLPRGDVVEIGSFQGRSAFLLSQLARKYYIGNFLAIDPWKVENNIQQEVPDAVNDESRAIDFDVIFEVFLTNLLPYNHDAHINFFRLPSDDAFNVYKKSRHMTVRIESDEFGITEYAGKIACLHIDGNHDYERADSDLKNWAPFVVPGGWIIMDDYLWCFGTGPQRAADEFMERNRDNIDLSFAIGSALFMRVNKECRS